MKNICTHRYFLHSHINTYRNRLSIYQKFYQASFLYLHKQKEQVLEFQELHLNRFFQSKDYYCQILVKKNHLSFSLVIDKIFLNELNLNFPFYTKQQRYQSHRWTIHLHSKSQILSEGDQYQFQTNIVPTETVLSGNAQLPKMLTNRKVAWLLTSGLTQSRSSSVHPKFTFHFYQLKTKVSSQCRAGEKQEESPKQMIWQLLGMIPKISVMGLASHEQLAPRHLPTYLFGVTQRSLPL